MVSWGIIWLKGSQLKYICSRLVEHQVNVDGEASAGLTLSAAVYRVLIPSKE
jgi:hypothetical protein